MRVVKFAVLVSSAAILFISGLLATGYEPERIMEWYAALLAVSAPTLVGIAVWWHDERDRSRQAKPASVEPARPA